MRSVKVTGNDTGGAAQVAAAHCPNERTLVPTVCSQTDPPMPQPAALWPSPRNVLRQRLNSFSSEQYQIVIAPVALRDWPEKQSQITILYNCREAHTMTTTNHDNDGRHCCGRHCLWPPMSNPTDKLMSEIVNSKG